MTKRSERQARYDAENTRQYRLKLNMNKDKDIMSRLAETGNMQGYIKMLIRNDMAVSPFLREVTKKEAEGYALVGVTMENGLRTGTLVRGESVIEVSETVGDDIQVSEE